MSKRRNADAPAPAQSGPQSHPLLPPDAWLKAGRRILVWGPSGLGKSTLVSHLAARLEAAGKSCAAISADPGSPGFGVPGALALAYWIEGSWQVERLAAICSLDAARCRLPLVQGLSRLASQVIDRPLLLDAPGVVRGSVAQELLEAMVEAVGIDAVLAIFPDEPTLREHASRMLRGLDCEVLITAPSSLARRLSKKKRARARTLTWDAWLEEALPHELSLSHLRLKGRPASESADWRGHQLALIDHSGNTLALGEVVAQDADEIRTRLRQIGKGDMENAVCLIRDAARAPDGLLGTAVAEHRRLPEGAMPPDLVSPFVEAVDPACFVHLGAASGLVVNGLFGDPLLHLRLRQQRRSLLFDLGDSGRLPAKIVHQVSDVFVSHAHIDHIGGFLWLLRSRIGEEGVCRLYGPPGLADHVCAFIAGVHWDRIADRGPRFEVLELHGVRLCRFAVQVGMPRNEGEEQPIKGGVLLDEPGFRVRAITLDHGIPVLAFAFEVPRTFRIRKDRLAASGLSGGPWVGALKHCLMAGELETELALPDGRRVTVSRLAEDMVEPQPPRRLVYATDLADSAANRESLIELARSADVLICEAGFAGAERSQAARTGHLTARACAEIAAQAGVSRLIPFHFSRRYESDPGVLYREIDTVYRGTLIRSSKINSST